jgi:hydroxylamine dehydrogenase
MMLRALVITLACLGTSVLAAGEKVDTNYDLAKKYYADHPGKGKFGEFWKPIPIQQYWNPKDFYKPPQNPAVEATREMCVQCHQAATPGWVHAWQNSTHAKLEDIRKLPDGDARAYKKGILQGVEKNLVDLGILKAGQPLKEVACIDCHGGVGKDKIQHSVDLRMPDRAVCGACHREQFQQAESEKEQTWPQNQWPKGHPSHAMDWKANVETSIWAAMPQREIAQGCDQCHYQQNKCDGCHTRHTFSAAEARQPEACATCHNGVDHNEWENYMLSKHGVRYATLGKKEWNFEVPLKDAYTKGGYTAPTCQTCHFEFKGEYSHNLVRKVRWAFNPTVAIAENLNHPWFEERKEAWIGTCSHCHSPRFSKAWLDTSDKGTIQGLEVVEKAKKVVEGLYKDGVLIGQQTNRPKPPAPETDAPGGFFQLFWAEGNNPTRVERIYANMWEHDVIKNYKGLFHANPGGYTYTEGWSPLMQDYAEIMDEATKLREMSQLKQSVKKMGGIDPHGKPALVKTAQAGVHTGAAASDDADSRYDFPSILLGCCMMAGGGVMMALRRKAKNREKGSL